MKTLIITLSVACAVVAGYFGVRYFTRRDLGFTLAQKYFSNLVTKLLHNETNAAGEADRSKLAKAG
jgi:hypothetical protein